MQLWNRVLIRNASWALVVHWPKCQKFQEHWRCVHVCMYTIVPFCEMMWSIPRIPVHLVTSFPGRRRNSLATYASSNCYFHCQKVGSTNQISEHCHVTILNPIAPCVDTLQSRPFITLLDRASVSALRDDMFSPLLLDFRNSKQLPPRAGKDHSHQLKNHVHSWSNRKSDPIFTWMR